MTTVYYHGYPVDETDISAIAAKFKLSYDLVEQAVETLQEGKEINLHAVSGTTRERLRALRDHLTTTVPQDTPEPENPTPMTPEPTDQIHPANEDERDEIVSHAAHSLMNAFSDPEGCFIVEPDGCCSINKANPPTLVQSYQAMAHIIKLKELGTAIDDKASWMRGSAICALEELHGEAFNVSQLCEESQQAYNTVYQAVNVFKAFRKKRYKVPFANHQEAFFAKISDDKEVDDRITHLILHKSEVHKLGSKAVRALCSIAKTMEPDDTVIRNIRSPQQAKDLIQAYKAAKSHFIVFTEEGVVVEFNDAVDAEHEGKIVINQKEKTATVNGTVLPIKTIPAPRPAN
jgi:hypothetical protein